MSNRTATVENSLTVSSSKTLKQKLPAIPCLDICPKEFKTGTQTDICKVILTEALFIIVKMWKQPSIDELVNKIHLHNG